MPNLNDMLQGERIAIRKNGKFTTKGNELKQKWQYIVVTFIRQQLPNLKIDKPIKLFYRYFEPNKRRDLDNISAFAHKVIQDSLVVSQVIKNDGWKEIAGFSDVFFVDKDNPRIEVMIDEVV
jgi:Holliday junction resolvase RusA-like endonuclease